MKYLTRMHLDDKVVELSKEEAKSKLEGCYRQEFLDEIFDSEIGFRLYTPYRDIWTQDDKGRVPIAGFYGTVG